jgi:hypothetical protein
MNSRGREDKLPWTKWFWSDWLADTGVRMSSLAARGLWADMLAIMSKSERRGYLMQNGEQIGSKDLAKFSGESEEVVERLLMELKKNGVYSTTLDGTIYNRRMARESELSRVRSEAGKLGGLGSKTKANSEANDEANAKQCSAYEYASASNSSSRIEAEFEDFWRAYPHDRGLKVEARKAFFALRRTVPLETIIKAFNGEMAYLKDKRLKEHFEQRPKYASTWLRSERWKEHLDYVSKPEL